MVFLDMILYNFSIYFHFPSLDSKTKSPVIRSQHYVAKKAVDCRFLLVAEFRKCTGWLMWLLAMRKGLISQSKWMILWKIPMSSQLICLFTDGYYYAFLIFWMLSLMTWYLIDGHATQSVINSNEGKLFWT